jgi:GNAT superfamily N-acetyltransferase
MERAEGKDPLVEKKDFTIRIADEHDFDAIRFVTLSASQEYREVMSPPLWEAYLQNLLEALDYDMQVERIVAVQNGAIVGSVSLYPPMANAYSGISTGYAWPEVRLLAVLPEMRGQGIGTSLMDECKQRAYNTGAKILGLHTLQAMQIAVRMYERMGFVRAPELDLRPSPGVMVMGYQYTLGMS